MSKPIPRIVSASIAIALCSAALANYSSGDSSFPRAVTIAGCTNVFAVSDSVLSGGAPEGDTAFSALAEAGVKTIISVDGARPDVKAAEAYGIRYVHLPFGYDGVPRERALELARAIAELPGKIYVHCHHGKHRSPAAVAGVMVCSQGWTGEQAVSFMKQAGTSLNYTGLYQTVKTMRPAGRTEIGKVDGSFPPIAKLPPFVDTMVLCGEHFDALAKSRKEQWGASRDNPDVVPADVALQIMELFRETMRGSQLPHGDADFQRWMGQAEAGAATLEDALWNHSGPSAEAAFKQLEQSCKLCHEKYRNTLKSK